MRVAVFGGTFNPVHYGHLRLAEEVREACSLDTVIFMPTFLTPHKTGEAQTPAAARLELLRLAVEGNPGFKVSSLEIDREGRSFTIDTVRELLLTPGVSTSLIMGSDSFNEITLWREYEELLRLSSFIVVPRPGYPLKKPEEALPVELAFGFWYDSKSGAYVNSGGNSITYVETAPLDISSSDIRERVRAGRSVRYLLPECAIEFIEREGLYREP